MKLLGKVYNRPKVLPPLEFLPLQNVIGHKKFVDLAWLHDAIDRCLGRFGGCRDGFVIGVIWR